MPSNNRNNHSNMHRYNHASAAFCALPGITANEMAEILRALFLVIINLIIIGILVIT